MNKIRVIDNITANILKTKTCAERIEIGFNLWISARDMLFNIIQQQNPELDHKEINKLVSKRLLGGSV